MKKHTGSCHCKAVRFEVMVDASNASRCNCSICAKVSQLGAIVKPDAFTLLSDESAVAMYEWGGKISRRFFCKRCGIHCFSRGHLKELGGDFVGINVNALDDVEIGEVKVTYWDGRHDNWLAGEHDKPWPIFG
jgi:hypothetical protein